MTIPRADEGGDPVCWVVRVCPECGRLADQDPPVVCTQCGTAIHDEPS